MKIVKLDDELYQYIASQTTAIGEETPSDILRRLLNFPQCMQENTVKPVGENISIFDKIDEDFQPLPAFTPSSSSKIKRKKMPLKSLQLISQKVELLLKSEAFLQETKGVNRFLHLLSVLYRTHPERFAVAVEPLQGHTRIYFARDEGILLNTGTHTKPKQIPDCPFWVITNTNTQRKMLILQKIMQEMGLSEDLIERVRQFFPNVQ